MSSLPIDHVHAPATEELHVVSHKGTLDTLGATASIVCAVHCAVVALALGLLPVLGFLSNPWIDVAFLCVSAVIGAVSLVPSWLHHHQREPLHYFVLGILLLLIARLLSANIRIELIFVLLGAGFVVRAHWMNRSLLKSCAHKH
jgi:hypothetical protein